MSAQNDKNNYRHVICVSWIPSLAQTRTSMLAKAGYDVTSLLGPNNLNQCAVPADLLILAHSVPHHEKRRALAIFRNVCSNPVLSLLNPHQQKLPEADFGVEAYTPNEFIAVVQGILRGNKPS